MAYTYDPIFAADPNNSANVASNAAIIIFDPSDPGKAPITITDVTGSPLPNPITVNKNGFGPAFQHATLDRVGWFGAGFTGYFTSYEGMKLVATDAAASAQIAASTAAAAAEADLAARIAAGQFVGAPGQDGVNGSNVLPTSEAIAQAVTTDGPAKTALSDTFLDKTAGLSKAEALTTYEALFNPKKYGAIGNGVADDTAAVQQAIDEASAAGGGTVFLPKGTYLVSVLTMKHMVTLRGAGPEVAIIKAKAGSVEKGLIQIAAGPIQFMQIQDVQLLGVMTVGQGAVYANSVGAGGTPNHGGWWSGGMRNVRIDNFAGVCIWLRANGLEGYLPHQYLVFDQVEARSTGSYECLLMSGQVGQIAVINGYYAGPSFDNTGVASVRVCREIGDDRTTIVSDASPYAVSFTQSSFQSNGTGLHVDRSMSVSAYGPHFEEVGKGVVANNGAAVTISGANMQLAGHNTALTGVGMQSLSTATINATDSTFFGTVDKHFEGSVNALRTNYTDQNFIGPITTGQTAQTAIQTGNYITLNRSTTALVNANATVSLKTIRSWKGVGESIFLRAFGGTFVIEYGGTAPGNILASGLTFPLTVPENAVVHLVKLDLAGGWAIVSVSKL